MIYGYQELYGGSFYASRRVISMAQRVRWADDRINAPPLILRDHINQDNDWATAPPVQFEGTFMSQDDDDSTSIGEVKMNAQLDRIELKLDNLLTHIAFGNSQAVRSVAAELSEVKDDSKLEILTTKQHVALQMLLGGRSNQEISERMGITLNTAKVHVRGVAKKVGASTRTQIILRLQKEFDACDEEEYLLMSGGLPKFWDARWDDWQVENPNAVCPYAYLYEKSR